TPAMRPGGTARSATSCSFGRTLWSPDGKSLAFRGHRGQQIDLFLLPKPDAGASSPPAPRPFLQTQYEAQEAMFSPDGRWLAYSSNETGQSEIYVRPAPPGPEGAADGRWMVSTGRGNSPRWA